MAWQDQELPFALAWPDQKLVKLWIPGWMLGKKDAGLYGTGISFEEPNPTGSRPRDLIGLYKQHGTVHQEQHTKKTATRHKRGE